MKTGGSSFDFSKIALFPLDWKHTAQSALNNIAPSINLTFYFSCQKQNKAFCRITRVYSCTRQWFYCGPVKKVMIWLSVQFAAQTFSHSENVKWQPVSQICHWEQQAIASDWSEWQQWLTRAKADWHNHICRRLKISFIIIFPSLHHTWYLSLLRHLRHRCEIFQQV